VGFDPSLAARQPESAARAEADREPLVDCHGSRLYVVYGLVLMVLADFPRLSLLVCCYKAQQAAANHGQSDGQ
jgi:hypothetical protein